MKILSSIIILVLLCSFSFAQTNPSTKNVKQATKGAERILQSLLGKELYRKHITIDTIDSREVPILVYTKNFKRPQMIGKDTTVVIYVNVMKEKDTLGFLNFYLTKKGELVGNYNDPLTYSTPELIVGYKRLLTNDFKIDLSKAIQIGRQKGFTTKPFLNVETDYKYTVLNKNIYIKVKYYWSFFEITMGSGQSALLNINAETGKIEKEEYNPGMPQ